MTNQLKEFRRVVKFETFFGDKYRKASDDLNEWLEKNPNAKIIDFKYSYARTDYISCNSICIMYEKTEEVAIDL